MHLTGRQWGFAIEAIFLVLVLLLAGYGLFFGGKPANTTQTSTSDFGTAPDRTFPFSTSTNPEYANGTSGGNNTSSSTATFVRKLSDLAVSGFGFTKTPSGEILARFAERENGHISEVGLTNFSNGLVTTQLTNVTVPRVRDFRFFANGTRVLIRYEGERGSVDTYVGVLKVEDNGAYTMEGSFMPSNILSITPNQDGTQLAYLSENERGYGLFTTTDASGNTPKIVATNPLSSWNIYWPRAGKLLAVTKPLSNYPGALFQVESDGTFTTIVSGKTGLQVTPSPRRGDLFLLSESTGENVVTAIYNSSTKEITKLPFFTMAEKCAWDPTRDTVIVCAVPSLPPSAKYPDDWQKGLVSFNDALWYYDFNSSEFFQLVGREQYLGEQVDTTDLVFDPSGQYLLLRNRQTDTAFIIAYHDLEQSIRTNYWKSKGLQSDGRTPLSQAAPVTTTPILPDSSSLQQTSPVATTTATSTKTTPAKNTATSSTKR